MSRRDTIIIAVLINASLLAFLFVMAINVDEETVFHQAELATVVENKSSIAAKQAIVPEITYAQITPNDEVDNLLKDLTMAETPQPHVVIDDPVFTLAHPVPTTKPKGGEEPYIEITVKKGDALSKIAQANHTTVGAIKKINSLTTEKLAIGQTLRVPVSTKKGGSPANVSVPPAVASLAKDQEFYVIKSGDTPWKIAKQFQVKFEDLLKLNSWDEEKARNLKIGEKIRVH